MRSPKYAWAGIAVALAAIFFFAFSCECTRSVPSTCMTCVDLGSGITSCSSHECDECTRYEWRWW